jgi:hypothetical protein
MFRSDRRRWDGLPPSDVVMMIKEAAAAVA